jgi:hypothetical protein
MNTITWSQIETECGNYRDGFVAIFRKYEGQDTDEKDGAGRVVVVTIASFARHVGISKDTFGDWVRRSDGRPVRPVERTATDRVHQGARNLSPEEKAALAAELLHEPEVAEKIIEDETARSRITQATDAHYRRKAVERADRTERKAADDGTDRRVNALVWVNRLGEAAERFYRDSNEALRHVGALPESERYWLTGAIDRAEATVRAARRYLELGKSEFDAELETLLENGA